MFVLNDGKCCEIRIKVCLYLRFRSEWMHINHYKDKNEMEEGREGGKWEGICSFLKLEWVELNF